MFRHCTMVLAVLCLVLSWSSFVSADNIILTTGLDESNNLVSTWGQSDAHWTVNITGNPAAQVVREGSPDWSAEYWQDGPNSRWIARDASTSANGNNEYDRIFDLTGSNLSTVSMAGLWSADDNGTLALNGHEIATLTAGYLYPLQTFSVPAGSPYFNQGLNTLSITITDSDFIYDGVRLEGMVSVPEPSTAALLVVGAIALIGCAWRRQKTSYRQVTTEI